ncbi:MAG: apolipoprotein A1/A4/E family protein, partial [Bacteroidales bacterium]|nr:apolipoprotein A1/A4/E family protein [Bacteroidales bacterium]
MNPILLSLSAALCCFGLTEFGVCAPAGTMPVPADTVSEATISVEAAAPEPTATADTVSVVPAQMPADTITDAGATETNAAREKMEALKEQAKELTEDVKEDLKEGWQDASESFKEQGKEFWNKLKEKAQEWKE